MAPKDARMKVRHPEGWVGAVEKMWGKYCSVQYEKDGYYRLCEIDDLEPISEEEFTRKWR